MPFTTPGQFVLLAVILLGGWLLGYASAPNVKKWKQRVRAQSDSFTAYHRDAEDKLRAANQRATDLGAELDALRADHADAERTISRLRAGPKTAVAAASGPGEGSTGGVLPGLRRALALLGPTPVAQSKARPAFPIVVESPAPISTIEQQDETTAPPPETPATEAIAAPIEPEDPAREETATVAQEGDLAAAEETFPERPTENTPDHAIALSAEAAAPSEDRIEAPAALVTMAESAPDAPAQVDPHEAETPGKAWLVSSARDRLTRIREIDSVLDTRLFGLGVTRFEDIASLSAEDEMALEQRLSLPAGYIAREQWRTQAALLRAGKDDEHAAQFAAVEATP